jgi:hypothetical protein
MFARIRPRLTFANVGVVIAIVLACGGTSVAQPVVTTAASLAKSVKQALRLGKSADKRSKQALAKAGAALPATGKAIDADKLDGLDSSAFLRDSSAFTPAGATAPNAELLDGKDSTVFLQDAGAFLAAGGKAADAGKLDGKDSSAFLQNASAFLGASAKAADSDLLDGLNSTAFLGASGKAVDADKLDNIDSTGFVQGNADYFAKAITSCATATCADVISVPGQYAIGTGCSATADVTYKNFSGGSLRLWTVDAGATPTVAILGSGATSTLSAAPVKVIRFIATFGTGASSKTIDATIAAHKDAADSNKCSFAATVTIFKATS